MAEVAQIRKAPPHDGEAEVACIGAMLLRKDSIPELRAVLKSDDFYFEQNRITYDAICALDDNSEPVDLLSLNDELRKQNKLEIVGRDYLKNIFENVVLSANVSHYAKIVREKSILRALISRSQNILESCFNENDDAEVILEQAEKQIFEIAIMRRTDEVRMIGEVLVETIQDIENLMKNRDSITGIPSGLQDLDDKTTGFHPGQLVILGARPGMGKTSLALNITQHVGIEKRLPVVYFSLEMAATELTMRILSAESYVDSQAIKKGYINQQQFVRLLKKQNSFRDAPIYIDDNPMTTVLDMRARLLRIVRKIDKIALVVVDYLQLMRPLGNRRGENRQQELAEISRALKALARELQVPVLALTQLSRAVETRPDSEPKLADIRESGAIEQDADIVIFIHKKKEKTLSAGPAEVEAGESATADDQPGMMELIIAKHRAGPTGRVPVAFIKKFTRFESAIALDENIYS